MAKKRKNALTLGITGGIGSGQSTFASFLKKKRIFIINADEKGREVIDKFPEVLVQLKKYFGHEVFSPDGDLDRSCLAKIVFSSRQMLEKLNHLIHPRMMELILQDLEESRKSGKYSVVAVDAALIYEMQMESIFDKIVCIDSPMEQRIKRVMERNNLNREDIENRMRSQIPLEDKADWADFSLPNDSSLDELKERTNIFWEVLTRN